jgi:hypothetical protein
MEPNQQKLREIKDDRDRLAHNAVSAEAISNPLSSRTAALMPSRFDARQKQAKFPPMTMAEIAKFADKVERISNEIIGLVETMAEQAAASLEKSRAQVPGHSPPDGAQ